MEIPGLRPAPREVRQTFALVKGGGAMLEGAALGTTGGLWFASEGSRSLPLQI